MRPMGAGLDLLAQPKDGTEFRSVRSDLPFSVLLLDLGHSKQVNDAFGHVTGDGAPPPHATTASIRVAAFPTHGVTPGDLIASADAALYQATRPGRDRVVAAPVSATDDADR